MHVIVEERGDVKTYDNVDAFTLVALTEDGVSVDTRSAKEMSYEDMDMMILAAARNIGYLADKVTEAINEQGKNNNSKKTGGKKR